MLVPTKRAVSGVLSASGRCNAGRSFLPLDDATGPPRQATGPPRSGAAVGVGMLRGAGTPSLENKTCLGFLVSSSWVVCFVVVWLLVCVFCFLNYWFLGF